MRYIILPTQFHNLIYKYLDDIHSKNDVEKEVNPYVESGLTYKLIINTDSGDSLLTYNWYEPGEDDDGNPHNGVGSLYVDRSLVDKLTSHLSVRNSRVVDIIADWVSERFDVDIDEVLI